MDRTPPTADELRAVFDHGGVDAALTVGLEEECFLVDPGTLDLMHRADLVLARTGDPRVKEEMPAAQVELVTPPAASVPEAIAALGEARLALLDAADGLAVPMTAAAHPFASPEGAIMEGAHYERVLAEYGRVARVQLVSALQVHVAVGEPDASLAVHDALRSFLPELAALAAGAPYHAGRDTGLASVRPKLCDLLPQQGVPPAMESWEALADAWSWGASSGAVPDPSSWWWELRTHPAYGTLELRVPDAQPTVAAAGAVAAFVQCLVAWLAERHAAGETLPVDPTWRIEHNRWSACRYGVEGSLADLRTGERRATRAILHDRFDQLGPYADRLGCAAELQAAHALADTNTAMRHREAHARGGVRAVAAWAAEAFTEGLDRAATAVPREGLG